MNVVQFSRFRSDLHGSLPLPDLLSPNGQRTHEDGGEPADGSLDAQCGRRTVALHPW
jgi:hypothetical protein